MYYAIQNLSLLFALVSKSFDSIARSMKSKGLFITLADYITHLKVGIYPNMIEKKNYRRNTLVLLIEDEDLF